MHISDNRLTTEEFNDLEHILQVLTALGACARAGVVAGDVLIQECAKAENALRKLLGFAV
jgi:hypothetical protein